MQASKIEIDDNLQETTKHGSYDFPIAIYTDKSNNFYNKKTPVKYNR